jgi:hypothetical protein
MSKLHEILKDVIVEKAHINLDSVNHCLIIDEPINIKKTELQSIHFKLCKGKMIKYTFHFAFKLDHSEAQFLGKLFAPKLKFIRQAVDAVVICEYNDTKCIFLIELKSNTRSGVTHKFKSSKLFLNFLKDYLNVYHNNQELDDYEVVSIVFDRIVNKGKPQITSVHGVDFYHQGFNKQNGNEADIRNFL